MSLRDPFTRYRVMAYVVGVMLIFVFLFIHVGHFSIVGYRTSSDVENVIGPVHGILYILYLATVVQMLFVYRIRFWWFVGMVVAGWCPFVSFVMERLVRHRLATDPTFTRTLEVQG